jgi:outer membrane lipoprotein-sorting protein
MPMKVTQISYIEEGDSVVQRNTYSNLKTSEFPSSSFFNFKIPQDATVIK